jgi:NADH-quinone oxidoreductase subunit K
VAFNKILYPDHLEGMFFSIFIIAVAAAEASMAIAIIINIYRRLVNIDVEKMNEMKY